MKPVSSQNIASLTQWLECQAVNLEVAGSIPVRSELAIYMWTKYAAHRWPSG